MSRRRLASYSFCTLTSALLLRRQLADEHFELDARASVAAAAEGGLDGEVCFGDALYAAGEFVRVRAARGREELFALVEGHVDDAEDLLLGRAARHKVFGEREPVVAAREEADEHDGLRAVVQKLRERFEREAPVARDEPVGQLEVRKLARAPDERVNHLHRDVAARKGRGRQLLKLGRELSHARAGERDYLPERALVRVRAEVLQTVARPRRKLGVVERGELDARADFQQRLAKLAALVQIVGDEDDDGSLDGACDVAFERSLILFAQRRTRRLP